jgi:RNA polymerase sigma-70 factor (ECF subfamily)
MSFLRNVTISDIDRLALEAETDVPFEMDEDTFRAFYDRTARPLWAYLARITDPLTADDLLQESYYRFLRAGVAGVVLDGEAHRRNYLFRIATNLARDGFRRRLVRREDSVDHERCAEIPGRENAATADSRADLHRAMRKLKPRERQMLWLAYAHGSSHEEIGSALGLKTGSIKPLLFRARRKLASLLRSGSTAGGSRRDE